MHVVSVSQPRLRFSANGILLALQPPRGHQVLALGVVVDNILEDEGAFGYDDGLCALAGREDGDNGGLSEGVDFFELGRCEHGLLVAVEDFDGVVGLDGLEEPDDALGARLFEPGTVSYCIVFRSEGSCDM